MSDRISPLKVMFPPLYWNAGVTYGGDAVTSDDSYSGILQTGSETPGWYGTLTTSGGTYGPLMTAGNVYATFWYEEEVDLIGLFSQGKTLQPLGISTQRTEPIAAAEARLADLYCREFVIWSTQRITSDDRTNLLNSFSPVPPYYEGSMHPEQVISGYAQTWCQNLQGVGPAVGFLSQIQRDNLGFMDMIAAPKLYCTKLLIVSGTLQNTGSGIPLYIDIPFSAEVMTVVEQDPDELEFFTGMARSLQPPE